MTAEREGNALRMLCNDDTNVNLKEYNWIDERDKTTCVKRRRRKLLQGEMEDIEGGKDDEVDSKLGLFSSISRNPDEQCALFDSKSASNHDKS